MHWPNILIKPEPIAGIEFSDTGLRFVLLKSGRKQTTLLKQAILEPLAQGDLSGSTIKNPEGVAKSLGNLAAKTRRLTQLAILSLPADFLYLKIIDFPADIEEYKIEESIALMAHFQLPLPPEESYYDWQLLPKQAGSSKCQVLLVAADNRKIDEVIKLFTQANIKLVAIEFHQLSASRALAGQIDPAYVMAIINQNGFALSLNDRDFPIVIHPLPGAKKNKTAIESELKHIVDFAQTENHEVKQLAILGEATDTYKTGLKIISFSAGAIVGAEQLSPPNEWAVAIGAAERGLVPRQDDKQISLMPFGTEEIYEHQKAVSFVSFLTKLTAALSIFFVAVFFGSWVLMNRLQTITGQQVETYSVQANTLEMQNTAQQMNKTFAQTTALLQEQIAYSRLLADIKKIIPQNITVSSVAVTAINQPIGLTGVAKTRTDLNAFIKTLNSSGMFAPTPLPLDNLNKRTDIPFNFILSLTTPETYATQ